MILNGLDKLGWRMVVCLSFLVIPTVLLIAFCLDNQLTISRYITQAWQAGFWQLPGLTHETSVYVADAILFLMIAAMGYLYVMGDKHLQQEHRKDSQDELATFYRILFWTAIFGVILVWVLPFHSRDLYGYINRGAQQMVFHANPYLVTVGELDWQSNPMFHNHWLQNPCPYGFYYALLARFLTLMGGGSFFLTFLIFKSMSLFVHLATTVLLYLFAKQIPNLRPNRVAYLYGWNPLILLHCIGNGHNDGLLALFLLLALYFLFFPKTRGFALPVLMTSILTKYSSILALPFFLIYGIKNPPRKPWFIGGLAAIGLFFLLALPYVNDGQFLGFPWGKLIENAGKSQHSIQSMLARAISYGGHFIFQTNANILLTDSRRLLKIIFTLGFVGYYGWLCWRAWRETLTLETLLAYIVKAMMVFILIASAKFHGWYFAMIFPLALLMPEKSPWFRIALLVSIVQLVAFTPIENIHVINALLLIVLPIVWVMYASVKRTEGEQQWT